MRTEAIAIPQSVAMLREAERWRRSTKPASVVEPGPGQVSVWDFPRPPAVERVLELVRVELAGFYLAETYNALRVCETASPPTYYLPRSDVRMDCLRRGQGSSMCEWKGRAEYLDAEISGPPALVRPQVAWWYPDVSAEYRVLTGYIGFYASRVDRCTVGEQVVRPQPGGFYAGWITSELTGPWKGEPGTEGW